MEMNNGATVAETLKAMREARGWDLDRISRKTYIRRSYLEAIEEGRYREIGDPVFVKGFVRNYALLLGLDGDVAVMQWNKENKDGHAFSEKRRKSSMFSANLESVEVETAQTKKRPFTVMERAILTLALLGALGFWAWMVYR